MNKYTLTYSVDNSIVQEKFSDPESAIAYLSKLSSADFRERLLATIQAKYPDVTQKGNCLQGTFCGVNWSIQLEEEGDSVAVAPVFGLESVLPRDKVSQYILALIDSYDLKLLIRKYVDNQALQISDHKFYVHSRDYVWILEADGADLILFDMSNNVYRFTSENMLTNLDDVQMEMVRCWR